MTSRTVKRVLPDVPLLLWLCVFCLAQPALAADRSAAGAGGARKSLGLVRWEDIPAADQQVSIVGEEDIIRARREKADPRLRKLTQAYLLPNGSMLYEKWENITWAPPRHPARQIVDRYADLPEFVQSGVRIFEADVKQATDEEGDVFYALTEAAQRKCVIFFRYSKDSVLEMTEGAPARYQAITGSACAMPDSPSYETLGREVLDLVARIRFDGGEYVRHQLLVKALGKLDDLEEERLREANRFKEGPRIEAPATIKTADPVIEVSGSVRSEAEIDLVQIEGEWVNRRADGSFEARLRIPAARDHVLVVAIDRYGNRTEKRIDIIWEGAPAPEKEREPERGRYYALLIGNGEYEQWRDLDTPHYDVQDIGGILDKGYGFHHQRILQDATQQDIVAALEGLRTEMKPEDNLLIYYSGHGVLHNGKGYWVPIDGYLDDPAKWIPNAEISRAIRRTPARRIIVVADSCYSGTLTQPLAARDGQADPNARSRTAISAGSGDEVVLEPVLAPGEKDNSVFAKKFIEALEGNRKESIGGGGIFATVKSLLTAYPQHPQYGAVPNAGHEAGGDFLFMRLVKGGRSG